MTDIATIGLRVDSDGLVRATGNLDSFTQASGRAEKSANRLSSAQDKSAQSTNRYAKSQKELDAAMRLVPAQITDIVTSLVSGQPAYLVAIQQGGQLKDSFGGIVPAARALLSVLNPTTAALAVLAATAGTFFLAAYRAQEENAELARSLILTGNAAGTTAGQLGLAAEAISEIVGSRGQASEVLAQLASTGRIAGENLQYFAQTAISAQRTLGASTEEIAKQFSELGKDPYNASLKLNEALNYLNATTIEQIDALMRAGQQTDAARVAQEAYANALRERSGEAEGYVNSYARAWRAVADEIKGAWNAFKQFNRPGSDVSDEERLAQLARARGDRILGSTRTNSGRNATLGELASVSNDEEERRLRERVEFLRRGAENEAEIARRTREGAEARERNNRLIDQALSKQEKLNRAIQQYERDQELMRLGGFTTDTPEQRARTLANLRAQYAESSGQYRLSPEENLQSDLQRQILDDQFKIQQEFQDLSVKSRQAYVIELNQIDQARLGYAESLENRQREFERELSSYGMGPRQGRYNAGINNIEDEITRQRRQLGRQLASGSISQGMYESELAGLESYHNEAIQQWNTYFDAIEARQKEFSAGLQESLLTYLDSVGNVGANLGQNLVSAFDRATASASDLAAANLLWGEGGKDAAKELARQLLTSVVSSFIQAGAQAAVFYGLQQAGIAATTAAAITGTQATTAASVASSAQIAAAAAPAAATTTLATAGANAPFAVAGIALVSAAIGALLGGAFEKGGRPPKGKISLVGEGGPELFIPDSAGTVIPNGGWSAAGGGMDGSPWTIVNQNYGEPMDIRIKRVVGNVVTIEQVPAIVESSVQRSAVAVGASLGTRSGAAWDGLQAGSVVRPRAEPVKKRG